MRSILEYMRKFLAGFKRPRVYIPLLIIILAIAAVISVIRNMNQPAVGNINEQPPAEAEKTDPYALPGTYSGKYISFKYPAHYKSVPSKLTGSALEVASYHTTNSTGKQINVEVDRGSLSSDSNIAYRRQHKELYTENDSRLGVEFIKNDKAEDTFFIAHNDLLASVAMTAPYSDQSGDAQFVATSLKWK